MNTTTSQTKNTNTADMGGKQGAAPKSGSGPGTPAGKPDATTAPAEQGNEQLAGPRGSTAAAYSTATKAEPDPGMPNQETGTAGFPYETYPGKDLPGETASAAGRQGPDQAGASSGSPSAQATVPEDQDHIRQRLRDGKLNAQDVAYLEKMLDQRGAKGRA